MDRTFRIAALAALGSAVFTAGGIAVGIRIGRSGLAPAVTDVSGPSGREEGASAGASSPARSVAATPSRGTGAMAAGDPLPPHLVPLSEHVKKRFGRLAPPITPAELTNPTAATMSTIVQSITRANAGDLRGAAIMLQDAIAAEPNHAIRDDLTLRLADVLLREATPASRKAAREALEKLGRDASHFDMQTNAIMYLRRLDAEAAAAGAVP